MFMMPTSSFARRPTYSACRSTAARSGISAMAIGKRPAGILHIGDLEPLRAERQRQLDEFRNLVDVVAMDRRVDGEWQAGRPRLSCGLELLVVAAAMVADAVRRGRSRALEAELQMVEPGLGERLDAAFGDADRRR